MTICSSGRIDNDLITGLYKQFIEFLQLKNISVNYTPVEMVQKLNSVRASAN